MIFKLDSLFKNQKDKKVFVKIEILQNKKCNGNDKNQLKITNVY
jgi:hypothetical protein